MWVGVEYLHVYYMIVKIGATAIVMIFNFVTRKMFLE
jgi:putative flippase GtrA